MKTDLKLGDHVYVRALVTEVLANGHVEAAFERGDLVTGARFTGPQELFEVIYEDSVLWNYGSPDGWDNIFGPFSGKPDWKPDPGQWNNLMKQWQVTHHGMKVMRVMVDDQHNITKDPAKSVIEGNAVVAQPNEIVDASRLHTCPRRVENPGGVFRLPKNDVWSTDDTCSYCGSMHPDKFMAGVENGDYELGATDKDYKVYVGSDGKDPAVRHAKFYFMHLSEDQMHRFVELYNAKTIKFQGGTKFYRMPFFMVPADV